MLEIATQTLTAAETRLAPLIGRLRTETVRLATNTIHREGWSVSFDAEPVNALEITIIGHDWLVVD